MACDCITSIQTLLRKEFDDPELSIDTGIMLHKSDAGTSLVVKPAGLAFHYRKKAKGGGYQTRKSAVGLTPSFCPFCGKAYGPDPVPAGEEVKV